MQEQQAPQSEPYDANARHGQNRAGVELGDDESFEEYVASQPVDPHRADENEDDEGPEIQARKHDRGHDVVAEPIPHED